MSNTINNHTFKVANYRAHLFLGLIETEETFLHQWSADFSKGDKQDIAKVFLHLYENDKPLFDGLHYAINEVKKYQDKNFKKNKKIENLTNKLLDDGKKVAIIR
jgi:hypothetical protein